MFEVVNEIKKLGLNEYESKAYMALLSLNSASASTVSKVSLIPRARVYDILTSLEKKGFIERRIEKPVSYSAFSPLTVVKKIEQQKKFSFEEEIKQILLVGKSLESHSMKNEKGGVVEEEVRLLKGQQNIYSKISQELENSKESVFFSTTLQGAQRKRAEFKKNIDALEKKGVKFGFGEASDLRYCVFDKKTLVLFLNSDLVKKDEETALIFKNSFLAKQFFKK